MLQIFDTKLSDFSSNVAFLHFSRTYIFTYSLCHLNRVWMAKGRKTCTRRKVLKSGGKGDVRGESYREWRTLAQKTLSARARARSRTVRYSSLLMNPAARGTPLEEHFYFCHSVCRESADRPFTMAIRDTPPSHRFTDPFYLRPRASRGSSSPGLTEMENAARRNFVFFPPKRPTRGSYQFHKTVVALNGATHKRQMDYFKFI